MSAVRDLTRWNRAGLGRFRYVDGNAATYLDSLRESLANTGSLPESVARAYEQWEALRISGDEDARQRLDRIRAQYHGERRDWAWEILRGFARACHVLTEHVDAYANEGFLGTANQWDNVRRLVEMLGYHPAPPASASTPLVLKAKPGKRGRVVQGFAVKHTPLSGGAAVVFETLADLDVDDRLNELRLKDHDRSPEPLAGGSELRLEGRVDGLKGGEPLVLEAGGYVEAHLIAGAQVGEHETVVTLVGEIPEGRFRKGDTVVHVRPAETLRPFGPVMDGTSGEKALYLTEPPTRLGTGDIVYISDGSNEHYRRLSTMSGARLVLDRPLGSLDLSRAHVSRARILSVANVVGREPAGETGIYAVRIAGDLSALAGSRVADTGAELRSFKVHAAAYTPVTPDNPAGGYTVLKLFDAEKSLDNPQALLAPPAAREWAVDSYLRNDLATPFPRELVTALPKKTVAGDFAVVTGGGQHAWGRLDNVAVDTAAGRATLSVGRWYHRGGGRYYLGQTRVYGHFKERVRVSGWRANGDPAAGASPDVIELEDAAAAALLVPGRVLFIEQAVDRGFADGFETSVAAVAGDRVTLAHPLPAGFTRGNTVVRANVVRAGHGERRPERVLGSGNATEANPVFVLPVKDVAFVADSTQASGVRADIELWVDGQRWQPVSTLRDSAPTDPHYVVTVTEDGHLRIVMGNGVNGRRVPTGTNNVRARLRVGTGLAGNLPAGALATPATPHPLIAGVRQPRDASGGNDMESKESLRAAAPATLLTLERAVSGQDFAHLAASHSSVWQARAFVAAAGPRYYESVEVVIVPAGGGALGDLRTTLAGFLQAHALPSVVVTVSAFESAPLRLSVTVYVDVAQYDREGVERAARAALLAELSLRRRRIGQALYLSEVYRIVEGVAGVSSSTCIIDDETIPASATWPQAVRGAQGDIRVLRANDRQVLYLDAAGTGLILDAEATTP